MGDENQAPEGVSPEIAPPPAAPPADPAALRARRGLVLWLAILVVGGLGGLLVDQPEAAALVAIAALFAAAHAADLDPAWRQIWALASLAAPVGGALFFVYLATLIVHATIPVPERFIGIGIAALGVVALGSTIVPSIADGLARRMFAGATSHALRLGAQIAATGILVAVPAWFAFDALKESLLDNPEPLLASARLSGSLAGYALLALGGAGCWVRRDLRESFARLGLARVTLRHVAIIVLGSVVLFGLNAGGDLVQERFFPALWKLDHDVTALLARSMTPDRVVLLGLSAGIGEEVTLRGGLQPRLGIVLTSVLFGALHVQYSWFGMVLVLLLGVVLGLIRKHASTTAAIIVHGVYDVLAVFTS